MDYGVKTSENQFNLHLQTSHLPPHKLAIQFNWLCSIEVRLIEYDAFQGGRRMFNHWSDGKWKRPFQSASADWIGFLCLKVLERYYVGPVGSEKYLKVEPDPGDFLNTTWTASSRGVCLLTKISATLKTPMETLRRHSILRRELRTVNLR